MTGLLIGIPIGIAIAAVGTYIWVVHTFFKGW